MIFFEFLLDTRKYSKTGIFQGVSEVKKLKKRGFEKKRTCQTKRRFDPTI